MEVHEPLEATKEDWKAPAEGQYQAEEKQENESPDEIVKVLLIGTNYISSNIALRLLGSENIELSIMDADPIDLIFINPDMEQYINSPRLKKYQISQWDLAYHPDYKQFDVIVNSKFIHDINYSEYNPVSTALTNTVAPVSLIEALRRTDFNGKLIHISSDKVYGHVEGMPLRDLKKRPITEKDIPNPVGARSASRYAQESLIRGLSTNAGIPWIVLRFGTLYGNFVPSSKSIHSWVKQMLLKEDLTLHEPHHKIDMFGKQGQMSSRDWVHQWDATGMVRSLCIDDHTHEVWNEVYNIGGMYRDERFIETMAEAVRVILKPWSPTSRFVFTGWRSKEEKGLRIHMSSQKAKEKLDYDVWKDPIPSIKKDVILDIMNYELGWNHTMKYEVKRLLGIFDEGERIAAEAEQGKPSSVSREVLENINKMGDQLS